MTTPMSGRKVVIKRKFGTTQWLPSGVTERIEEGMRERIFVELAALRSDVSQWASDGLLLGVDSAMEVVIHTP